MSERLSAERLAEIRERDAKHGDFVAFADHVGEYDRRDLLRELDAVTRERDEWERKANQAADNFDEITRKGSSPGLDWVSEHGGRD